MTYTAGGPFPDESFPGNITARHRAELAKARDFLESIAPRHPEWIIRKCRR